MSSMSVMCVERLAGLNNSVREHKEPAHDRNDNSFAALAALPETFGEGFQEGIPAHGDQGRKEQAAPQVRVSDFREATTALDCAGFKVTRTQPGIGSNGFRIAKFLDMRYFAKNGRGGRLPQSRNRFKQRTAPPQFRVTFDELADPIFNLANLAIQKSQVVLNRGTHRCRQSGCLQPRRLLGTNAIKISAPTYQALQKPFVFRRRRPRIWCMRLAKSCNERRIDLIGLCPQQLASRKGFDPAWVNNAHLMATIGEKKRQRLAVAAGRFHAGVNLLKVLLPQPFCKLLEAGCSVFERMGFYFETVAQQGNVYLRFADIYPKNPFHPFSLKNNIIDHTDKRGLSP